MIDFNAEASVVKTGSGKYLLNPVIRGFIEANTSAIFGTILPENEPMKVLSNSGSRHYNDSVGHFDFAEKLFHAERP